MKIINRPILSFIIALLLLFTFLSSPASYYKVSAADDTDLLLQEYQDYRQRFDGIKTADDIDAAGFRVIEDQIFPIQILSCGEASFIPAFDRQYMRLALFLADKDGNIVYKTDQLETNNRNPGELLQYNQRIAAVSFLDMNRDGLTDIGLITYCMNRSGDYSGKFYKVGDVLFQNSTGFYRDYRISDRINRFSMNKSIKMIISYVRDRYSTEFLYTATTLAELKQKGLQIITEQHYTRQFEKLGQLEVVPGFYSMADYDIFMIYLVDEQGDIVWSLQPMGEYDNLYALKGMAWRDIDGDGMRDIAVLARYSYENSVGYMIIQTDYSIYYQRTDGFSADTELKNLYRCSDDTTMTDLIQNAHSYWGWPDETT